MRPIYRPRIHGAWYTDEAIGLNVEEPFPGGLASSSGKRASQKHAGSLSDGRTDVSFWGRRRSLCTSPKRWPNIQICHKACRFLLISCPCQIWWKPLSPEGTVIAFDDSDSFRDMRLSCNSRSQVYRSSPLCRTSDSASSLRSCDK